MEGYGEFTPKNIYMFALGQNHCTLLNKNEANKIAELSNADLDDVWTYKAVHPEGKGYSFVEVYDEDGNLLGKL